MLNVLRGSAGRGIAATSYPNTPEAAPATYRGQVLLRVESCEGDGACARVCPSAAIVVANGCDQSWIWELDDARCVFCGLCAEACPTAAIAVSNEFELGVRHRDDLVTRVALPARTVTAESEDL